jgi:hypothetical protein
MNDKTHGAMPGKVAPENGSKAEVTQVAELALAGHAVHKGRSGDYLVCKYGLTRYCQDFDDLQAFARRLGVSK